MEIDLSGSTSTGSEATSLPLYNTQGALNSETLPADIEKEISFLPYDRREAAREKIRRLGDAIQPHTDEGGDALYIGDCYEAVNPTFLGECERDVRLGPYAQYLQILAKKIRDVEYLFLWMLVGCSPLKWKFVKHFPKSRAERVARTHVSVIEYNSSGAVTEKRIRDSQALQTALLATGKDKDVRLFVVEDLSRDVVESLGSHFQIDPTFFLSHISDYLFHNPRDRWGLPPDIQLTAQQRSHLSVDFLRARYFKTEDDFQIADEESGKFNILRRLDSERSRRSLSNSLLHRSAASVTSGRSKASYWWSPASEGAPTIGIILVDPTVSTGLPLWGGARSFEPPPSMSNVRARGEDAIPNPRGSLFEEVVHWSCRLSKHDLSQIKHDPRALFIPTLKIVVAEWLTVFKYMTTMIGIIDWGFEKPLWGSEPTDYDDMLRKIRPWRRNMHYYRWMIKDAFTALFTHGTNQNHPAGLHGLRQDFEQLQERIDYLQMRIERLWDTFSNAVAIEDSRRAVRAHRNNTGQVLISILATIFLPLNFATSFLSMSADFSVHSTTFWLFFAIGFPLLGLTTLIVVVAFPALRDKIRRDLRRLFIAKKKDV